MSTDFFIERSANPVNWHSLVETIGMEMSRLFPDHTLPTLEAKKRSGEPSALPAEPLGTIDSADVLLYLNGLAMIEITYERPREGYPSRDWYMVSLGRLDVDLTVILGAVTAAVLCRLGGIRIDDSSGVLTDSEWTGCEELLQSLEHGSRVHYLERARRKLSGNPK